MAPASSSVRRGLLRVRSSSSSVRIGGRRWMVKESAPTPLTMAVETIAFMPWMSVTTVTIEVTATMLPSTVMNDRSLFAQMALSAIRTDSRICDMPLARALAALLGCGGRRRDDGLAGLLQADDLPVGQLAHRRERPGDHLIARRKSR